MSIYLFSDTETTGFPKRDALVQSGQARICQQAFLLTDDNGFSLAEICHLIKPDGWEISEGAAAVTGHTKERCERFGISSKSGCHLFLKYMEMADFVVCHNAEFDKYMFELEAAYHGMKFPMTPWLCTKELAEPIMKIPPTPKMMQYEFTRNKFKAPNMAEALKFFCNRDIGDGAHDAMVDVRACKDVFFAIKEMEGK